MLRGGVLSIGAFALGIAFEKNFHLYADVPASPGDVVDGNTAFKPPPSKFAKLAQHGFPSNDSLRSYRNFVLSYDSRNRVAHWVLEHLTPNNLGCDKYDRSGVEFFEDKSFHQYFRATSDDYRKSGYDRGHLAAAGNYRSDREEMKSTFVLSNIAPQVGHGFNRDKWNELERHVRSNVHKYDNTWVCTGPLYLPQRDVKDGLTWVKYQVIGRNNVAVPTHFFKTILYERAGYYYLESFLVPNRSIDNSISIDEFRIHPDVIERAAGFLFFSNLPRKQIQMLTRGG